MDTVLAMKFFHFLSWMFLLFCLVPGLSAQSWLPAPQIWRIYPFETVRGLYYFTDRGNFQPGTVARPALFDEKITAGPAIDFRRNLAFTFDDVHFGPSLDAVLDVLRDHKIPAVFFLTVSHMGTDPPTLIRRQLERMIAEGHELANHTADHPDLDAPVFARPGSTATLDQFQALEKKVDQILGYHYPMRYIRPPFGVRGNDGHGIGNRMSLPGRVDDYAREVGQEIILWHINSLDFLLYGSPADPATLSLDEVLRQCLDRIRTSHGGVVLCHANVRTPELLRRLLAGLEPGWHCTTVAELLKIKYGSAG